MALARQYRQYEEKDRYTEAEYFEFEQTAFGRWEYLNGKSRAMAGGSDDHGMISTSIGRVLGNSLVPRGCRVYVENIKIHTGDGTNTFPDVTVICGERQYYLGKNDVVLNPLLVVEVLSPSTQGYDRGEKFDHYQTIETLQEYLLVEQDEPRIILYTRRDDHWEMRQISGVDKAVALTSVDVMLNLSDIYALIEFDTK
jgi:Uma2 family endonuclease